MFHWLSIHICRCQAIIRPCSTDQLDIAIRNDIGHVNAQCLAHAFKCLFVNARGLISEIDILKTYIHEIKIDTIGVAETF